MYSKREGEESIFFSAATSDNFKQYLIIIFRLFLSLSKAGNGDVSRILSPVFQNMKWDSSLVKACYPQQDSFPRISRLGWWLSGEMSFQCSQESSPTGHMSQRS